MSESNPLVQMMTSRGEIILELFRDKAPISVENFIRYAREGHYNGTIFHRVIKGFMVQGGGLTVEMEEKPTHDPIENEARNGLKHKVGTVAMARTTDVHSATAQFFINTEVNKELNFTGNNERDFGYAVFGAVVDGMDIVYTIEQQPVEDRDGFEGVPTEPIVIESVEILD